MDLGSATTFHKVPRGGTVFREERPRGKIKLAPLRETGKVRRPVGETKRQRSHDHGYAGSDWSTGEGSP